MPGVWRALCTQAVMGLRSGTNRPWFAELCMGHAYPGGCIYPFKVKIHISRDGSLHSHSQRPEEQASQMFSGGFLKEISHRSLGCGTRLLGTDTVYLAEKTVLQEVSHNYGLREGPCQLFLVTWA